MAHGEEVFTSDVSAVSTSSVSTSDGSTSPVSSPRSKGHSELSGQARKRFKLSKTPASGFQADLKHHTQHPSTSGVMDFIEWAISTVLSSDDRRALAHKFSEPVQVGSMCSGMGTEDIAMHAIKVGLALSGLQRFSYVSSFKAESDAKKAAFLRRRLPKDTPVFSCNSEVAEFKCPSNPTCRVLCMGIVCKSISSLSQDKKSVSDATGKSGQSFKGMCDSLKNWDFEQKPILIILECTKLLGKQRKVDQDMSGTECITEELSKHGYVGKWALACATMFYLPQSRPRVYGMFLKVSDSSLAVAKARQRDLDKAFKIISDARLHVPEALASVLGRVPEVQPPRRGPAGKTSKHASSSGDKWPKQHEAKRAQLKLPEDLCQPPKHFLEQALKLMPPRAADALWIKIARAHVEKGFRWDADCCIAPVRMSVRFGNIGFDVCPCVTPGENFVISQGGKLSAASGLTFLALQGVQTKEVRFLRALSESDSLLRDLAGNAFTANVIAIFLLAGLLVM